MFKVVCTGPDTCPNPTTEDVSIPLSLDRAESMLAMLNDPAGRISGTLLTSPYTFSIVPA